MNPVYLFPFIIIASILTFVVGWYIWILEGREIENKN
jgi:hypothetical protein